MQKKPSKSGKSSSELPPHHPDSVTWKRVLGIISVIAALGAIYKLTSNTDGQASPIQVITVSPTLTNSINGNPHEIKPDASKVNH